MFVKGFLRHFVGKKMKMEFGKGQFKGTISDNDHCTD